MVKQHQREDPRVKYRNKLIAEDRCLGCRNPREPGSTTRHCASCRELINDRGRLRYQRRRRIWIENGCCHSCGRGKTTQRFKWCTLCRLVSLGEWAYQWAARRSTDAKDRTDQYADDLHKQRDGAGDDPRAH